MIPFEKWSDIMQFPESYWDAWYYAKELADDKGKDRIWAKTEFQYMREGRFWNEKDAKEKRIRRRKYYDKKLKIFRTNMYTLKNKPYLRRMKL
jgi:hypothetical protein